MGPSLNLFSKLRQDQKACVSGANLGAEKPSTEISWKTNGQGGHFILSFDLGYFIFA